MIPRARANFSLKDLADAALVREGGHADHKATLAEQLRSYFGVDDVLLTPSGRGGLYAILKALDRRRVVIPAYTCNAVTEAATLAGKAIDYAEVEVDGFNVDPNRLAERLGPDAVFIATHQFGIPCDIERVLRICRDRGALVVEDAAASLGTRVDGKLTGTFGDAAFFSFDTTKLITVPLKGGAVIARETKTLARIRRAYEAEIEPMPVQVKARLLAMSTALVLLQDPVRYRLFHRLQFERRGRFTAEAPLGPVARTQWYRYDFTQWQALVATRQMDRIEEIIARRRALYAEYGERLQGKTAFRTPPADTRQEWAPIRFPIRVEGDKVAFYREATRRGVDFAFSFTFIEAPPAFEAAHALSRSVLDVPFYFDLTHEELDSVVETLAALDNERRRSSGASERRGSASV